GQSALPEPVLSRADVRNLRDASTFDYHFVVIRSTERPGMALAQSLPITVLLIILETVVGGMLVLLFTDFEGRASSGFLTTSGLIFAAGAGLAYLLRF